MASHAEKRKLTPLGKPALISRNQKYSIRTCTHGPIGGMKIDAKYKTMSLVADPSQRKDLEIDPGAA